MSAQVGQSERGFSVASELFTQQRIGRRFFANLQKLAVARGPTRWGRVFGKVGDEQELTEERRPSYGIAGTDAGIDRGFR